MHRYADDDGIDKCKEYLYRFCCEYDRLSAADKLAHAEVQAKAIQRGKGKGKKGKGKKMKGKKKKGKKGKKEEREKERDERKERKGKRERGEIEICQ